AQRRQRVGRQPGPRGGGSLLACVAVFDRLAATGKGEQGMDQGFAQDMTYRAYAAALYAALTPDPFYAALEIRARHPEGRRAAMLAYYDYSMLEAERYGLLCLDDAPGASVWALPIDADTAARKAREKAEAMRRHMGEESAAAYDAINANMARGTLTVVDPTDWYLSILGLDPARQGQGRGAALVAPILARADAAGVACYCETFTPRNMSFYERLGFASAGRFHEPVTGSDYHVMRRPAGG
ncbi:GNAT family N-acetyltransferase, partial [Cribrihabitans sp. XS_ASV171]